ncbi:MAG: TA system VapC family ribonuclease toxin [Terriglobales bacterium]
MIALDTNILVSARRAEMPHHAAASALIGQLITGDEAWAIPWPCIYEFIRVVTHPRGFKPPSRLAVVLEDLQSLFGSPSLLLLGEGPGHAASMRQELLGAAATGNLAFDAHIAALVRQHGVTELWTLDRDFHRFPGLRIRNPFAIA